MNKSYAGFAGLIFAALTGCGQGTPGGPGAKDGKSPTFGQNEDTFNLSLSVFSYTVQQGEQSEVTIGIKRAKNFDQDVALIFGDVPQGVVIEPAKPMIKHGDQDAKVRFKAADEASVGDFKVKLTGHPTKGADAEIDLKIGVTAKDTFTLNLPSFAPSVKQGESQMFTVGIKREKKFDQDVTLKFGEMPTGVTVTTNPLIIKNGDEKIQITVAAAGDAALGNFTIKLTGHPAKGADSVRDISLSVVKK